MPTAALQALVCGSRGDCRGLVASYDTDQRHVLYVDRLDMHDPTDQSFIAHELVHFLQHRLRGDALMACCADVIAAERGACTVQNLYLDRIRQWRRVGEMLRFMHCPESEAAAEATVRFGGFAQVPDAPAAR